MLLKCFIDLKHPIRWCVFSFLQVFADFLSYMPKKKTKISLFTKFSNFWPHLAWNFKNQQKHGKSETSFLCFSQKILIFGKISISPSLISWNSFLKMYTFINFHSLVKKLCPIQNYTKVMCCPSVPSLYKNRNTILTYMDKHCILQFTSKLPNITNSQTLW